MDTINYDSEIDTIKIPFYISQSITDNPEIIGNTEIDIQIDNAEIYGYDYLLKLEGQMDMRLAYNPDGDKKLQREFISTGSGFRITKCQPTANFKRNDILSNHRSESLYGFSGGLEIKSLYSNGLPQNMPLLDKNIQILSQDGHISTYFESQDILQTEQIRGSKYNIDTQGNDIKRRGPKQSIITNEDILIRSSNWIESGKTVHGNQIVVYYKTMDITFDSTIIPLEIREKNGNSWIPQKCSHAIIYTDDVEDLINIHTEEQPFISGAPKKNNIAFQSESGNNPYGSNLHNIATLIRNNIGGEYLETHNVFRQGENFMVDQNSTDPEALVNNLSNLLYYMFIDSVDIQGKIIYNKKDTRNQACELINTIEQQMFESLHKDIDLWIGLTSTYSSQRENYIEEHFEKGVYKDIRRVSNPLSYTQTWEPSATVNKLPTLSGYQSTTITHSCIPKLIEQNDSQVMLNLRGLAPLPEDKIPTGGFTFITRTDDEGNLTDVSSISIPGYDYYHQEAPQQNLFPISSSILPFYQTETNIHHHNQYCRVGDVFTVYHTPDPKSKGCKSHTSGNNFDIVVLSVMKPNNTNLKWDSRPAPINYGYGVAIENNPEIITNGLETLEGNTLCGYPNKIAILYQNENQEYRVIYKVLSALDDDNNKVTNIYSFEILADVGKSTEGELNLYINDVLQNTTPYHFSDSNSQVGYLLYNNSINSQVPFGPRNENEMKMVIDYSDDNLLPFDKNNNSFRSGINNSFQLHTSLDNIIPQYDQYYLVNSWNIDNMSYSYQNLNWNKVISSMVGKQQSFSKEGVLVVALVSNSRNEYPQNMDLESSYLSKMSSYTASDRNNTISNGISSQDLDLRISQFGNTEINGELKDQLQLHFNYEAYNLTHNDNITIPKSVDNSHNNILRSLIPDSYNSTGNLDWLHFTALIRLIIDHNGIVIPEKISQYQNKDAFNRINNTYSTRQHLNNLEPEKLSSFIHIPDLNTGLFLTGTHNVSQEMYFQKDFLKCPISNINKAVYGKHFTFYDLDTHKLDKLVVDVYMQHTVSMFHDDLEINQQNIPQFLKRLDRFNQKYSQSNQNRKHSHAIKIRSNIKAIPSNSSNKNNYTFNLQHDNHISEDFIPRENINQVIYSQIEIKLSDIENHLNMNTPLDIHGNNLSSMELNYTVNNNAIPSGKFYKSSGNLNNLSETQNLELQNFTYPIHDNNIWLQQYNEAGDEPLDSYNYTDILQDLYTINPLPSLVPEYQFIAAI